MALKPTSNSYVVPFAENQIKTLNYYAICYRYTFRYKYLGTS